jgi:hypothetical protein
VRGGNILSHRRNARILFRAGGQGQLEYGFATVSDIETAAQFADHKVSRLRSGTTSRRQPRWTPMFGQRSRDLHPNRNSGLFRRLRRLRFQIV